MSDIPTSQIKTKVGTIGKLQGQVACLLGSGGGVGEFSVGAILPCNLEVPWAMSERWKGKTPKLEYMLCPGFPTFAVLAAVCPRSCLSIVVDLMDLGARKALLDMCEEEGVNLVSLSPHGRTCINSFDISEYAQWDVRQRAAIADRSSPSAKPVSWLTDQMVSRVATRNAEVLVKEVPCNAEHLVVHLVGDERLHLESIAAAVACEARAFHADRGNRG